MTREVEDRDQDDFIQQDEDYYAKEDALDDDEEEILDFEEALEEYDELNFDPDKQELERHQEITRITQFEENY